MPLKLINAWRTLSCILSLCAVHAAATNWRFSNPKPHGNNILDMAFRDGVIWQIGDRGQIYTSGDLDTWIPRESGVTSSLRGITFFQGKPFISTEAGGILSGSGDSFNLVSLGTSDWLEGIAASPGIIVAVGDNGAIYSSSDGANWTRRGNFNTWLRSVTFGANLFVTVGEDGFLATSTDGQNWDKRALSTSAHLNRVEFINDRFWVVGDNGTVFTNNLRMTFGRVEVPTTNTLFAIAGNSNEVVIGGENALVLGDLKTGAWASQVDANSPTLAPFWPYYSAIWDGRLFLVGGRTGLKTEGFRTNSTAPMRWYTEPQPTRNWLWSAVHLPDLYAACGVDGTIVTSDEGVDWFREVVPAAASRQALLGIGGNTNALIAVGTAGTILRGPNIVTNTPTTNASGQVTLEPTSLFGVIWESASSPTLNDLQAVAASDKLFVVGGAKGTLLTSGDGRVWQPAVSGVTNFLSGATAWPGGWVVCGSAGLILNSPDGVVWSRQNSGVAEWVYGVRYVGGKLVAVGEGGIILTSPDAKTWTRSNSPATEWLNDVAFANGIWYAAGTSGEVLTSPDAITWTSTRSVTSKSLYGAVTDGQKIVMVGLEGVILRKRLVPLTTPVNFFDVANIGAETLFLFEGAADQRFVIESKARLEDPWVQMETLEITSAGGTLIYSLPLDASRAKFFRTRLVLP